MKTLKQLRKGRGISQGALAQLLQEKRGGKAWQGPISVIEAGKISPTVRRLSDILEALGYTITISVKAKGEPTVNLDVTSLMGELPHAKDAGESAGGEGLEPSTDQPVSVAALDP